MKKIIYTLLLLASYNSYSQDFSAYVNPMIGTGGVGHTYPGATVPYGMVQVSPDTRNESSWEGCGGYWYNDSLIYGFSHTHLSGTGCSDYGDVLLMPGTDKISFDPIVYGSPFNHATEKSSPGYYSVVLNDSRIKCEMTASTRVGVQKYTYPSIFSPSVLLDLMHRDKVLGSSIKIVNDHTIEGYRHSEAWAKDQYVYFSMEFSQPFSEIKMMGRTNPLKVGDSIVSDSIRIAFVFKKSTSNIVEVRTGISSVSTAGAMNNRITEIGKKSFLQIQTDARAYWNKELGRIAVYDASQRNLTNFYTSLYHMMIVPNVYSDIDGRYRGRDNKIHIAKGYTQYSVFSLWDTFRAAHPMYALIDKKRSLDFIKTFLAQYEQGGRLPVWELGANETDCMIGYHSVSVIADALTKDITEFNVPLAFEAVKKSANWNHLGLPAFNANNYLQIDDESESVSKTLEYAYDAWCVAQIAKYAGKNNEALYYNRLAFSYRNLYDHKTGFMRPRRNGNWLSPFDPLEVNNHYTEANSYQYSFFVPQDIPGMIDMMGGIDLFDKKLDGLFNAPTSTTGRQQADITGLIGQYAHGNEPSHHMAYLYNYIGKPWKTQEVVHRVVDSLYNTTFDGLPGNEDCGQMSAWYVWSALGFYPVTPGSTQYAIGTPLFDHAIINLENGKKIDITTKKQNPKSFYIESLRYNGSIYDNNLISYDRIKNGCYFEAVLKDYPNKGRGANSEQSGRLLPSGFINAPFIITNKRNFADSLLVTISNPDSLPMRYWLNNDTTSILEYTKPFHIYSTSSVSAYSYSMNVKSGRATGFFNKLPHPNWKVDLISTPGRQYAAEGPQSLIDGVNGNVEWRKGDWHGYQDQDMEVVFTFDKEETIGRVMPGFLQDTRAWILMPTKFEVYLSNDGIAWTLAGRMDVKVDAKDYTPQVIHPELVFLPQKAKYMKVKAYNFGNLPSWHLGAGGEAYIFCDEITVSEK
jgi:predicted alpha-1,2-mannosidase